MQPVGIREFTRTLLYDYDTMHEPVLSWPWCLAMVESRADNATAIWSLASAINREYAGAHGYGFYRARLPRPSSGRPACVHPQHGARAASWCKLAVTLRLLLLGVRGRPCAHVMYIDSDAFILNASMSIDEYLERARSVGDEAVQDARWELLLSSDFPYRGAGPCAGVFWVKNSPDGCSIMRAWWDWPSSPHLLKPWDQGAVNEFYVRARPFGDRVRVLPTGRFFHFVMGTASPADPWLVHVLARHRERHAQAVARLLSAALRAARGVRRSRHGDVGGEGGLPDPCEHAGESALFDSQALGALLARARASGACPPAQRGVDSLGRRLPQTVTEGRGGAQLRPQRTHLNGTALAAPSPAPSREGLLTWMLRSLRGRKRDAPSSPAPLRPCWRGEGRNNESQLWSCWERWWEDVGLRFAEQQRQWLRWQMHKGAHALASLKSAALFPRVQRPHGARALAVTHTPHAAKKPESGAARQRGGHRLQRNGPVTNAVMQHPASRCLGANREGLPLQTTFCSLVQAAHRYGTDSEDGRLLCL